MTLELLQKYQNLDPVIRQLKSWHNYETKPIRADIKILGNKTLLRYFRKFYITSINENTNFLEHQTLKLKVNCLPISMILLEFPISNSLNTKGHAVSEKTNRNFIQNFYFPNALIWIKVLCNNPTCQLHKPYPH